MDAKIENNCQENIDVVCNTSLLSEVKLNKNYKIYDNRIESFENWPCSIIISPSQMSKAGFYYTGYSDKCICTFCGVTLLKWQWNDDPVFEHKKYSNNCSYLKMVFPSETELIKL